MEDYYSRDRIRAIWDEIGALHMCYLEMDDSPQKIIKRHELEDTIREFLNLAPHTKKFIFEATANVLHRSASTKKDFSGYKAALGFNAIAMYAANLWNQPWRNEYKQLKLYSGYYKHQIDANLTGAQILFEIMGYKNEGNQVLTLDGPVCPDVVVSISQDALVAYVECQVLKAIWEEVSSRYKVTWLEVLEFRQSHISNPKYSSQAINYLCHERQFQHHTRSHSQGTDIRYYNSSATLPSNHSFPPLYSSNQTTLPSPCMYNNGYYPNNYPIYASPHPHHNPYHTYTPLSHIHTVSKPFYNPNCHHPNGYSVPVQPLPHICPTAQLIEVESQQCDESGKSTVSNNEESWDYVYKDLENQGYSKDLGERGDVLSHTLDKRLKAPIKEAKKIKSNNLDKILDNLCLNDKKHSNTSDTTLILPENGYTKNVPEVKTTINNIANNKPIDTKTAYSKILNAHPTKPDQSNEKVSDRLTPEAINRWQCTACTYLNDKKRDICEMCGKSKVAIKDEMEIGGSQCPKCTLVNRKENKVCSACSSSLKGSPTYI